MRKLSIFLFLMLVLSINSPHADNLIIGYLSPSGELSNYSESFLNGLSLSLPQNASITIQEANNNIQHSLENLYLSGADIIIGPFTAQNINKIENSLCSGNVVTILPFARAQYQCDNIFTYNYDPIEASKQLANYVCKDNSSSTLVLYSYDNINMMKENAFTAKLKECNMNFESKGFQQKKDYSELIKSVFGVKKIKDYSIFSDEIVFLHSAYFDNVVIFAPENDFLSIVNLMDYYDIDPDSILSSDITVNRQFLPIRNSMLKKLHIITPYFQCQKSAENTTFVLNYKREYQTAPNFMAALGYDIGRIVNGSDRVSLKSWLYSVSDFEGLIGHLFFFDDRGKAVINYVMLNYKDIMQCKKKMLNR